MQSSGILRISRILIAVVGIPVVAIASQGYNVLYLFLLADLICAGAVFPVLFGLYSRRLTGQMAFWSSLLGTGAGALFFPQPNFSPWNRLPFAGDLLVSFAVPIVVSCLISLVWIQIKAQQGMTDAFDFKRLDRDIRAYGDATASIPASAR
jgi:Na+/proline symporter